jgi:hypothetical protein
MVRQFPFDPTVAVALPALVTILQGDITIRFTTWGHTVIVEDGSTGVLYEPWPGSDITGIQVPSDGTPLNADVVLMAQLGSPIQPGDATRGMLDNWPISIELFDPGNLAAGTFLIMTGTIGSVEEDSLNKVTIAANGQLRLAAERAMNEKYSLTGRESLGDDRCKIPICLGQQIDFYDIARSSDYVPKTFNDGTTGLIKVTDCYGRVRTGVSGNVEDYANVYYECTTQGTTASVAPTYNPALGATTTDGSAVFTAKNSWGRYARGFAADPFNIVFTSLPDTRASDDTWYKLGGLFIRSGAYNAFPVMVINTWDHATLTVTLFLPIQPDLVPANTQFEIYPGCDLTYQMCQSRFANIANIRAEYLVPPPEAITGL